MKTDKSNLALTPWAGLRHPLVRNLAWCIFSPSLIRLDMADITKPADSVKAYDSHDNINDTDAELLQQLDREPAQLEHWMRQLHTTRLGFQFEYYWQFWWQHRYPELEHRFNIQLHREGKTLGEIDALSWNPVTGELVHTELAVKFYLGIESHKLPPTKRADRGVSWVGPNVIDRLDLKWQQLNEKQLQRLRAPVAQRELLTHSMAGIPPHWQISNLLTQLVVRGRLFHPAGSCHTLETPYITPETPYINAQHLQGRWLFHCQIKDLSAPRWCILKRAQWLSPEVLLSRESLEAISPEALTTLLAAHFCTHQQPVQIVALERLKDVWQERERLFIVPDQWPVTAPM